MYFILLDVTQVADAVHNSIMQQASTLSYDSTAVQLKQQATLLCETSHQYSIPAYLSPALEEIMPGTSSAEDSMILHSSMYFRLRTALRSSSALNCSNASKK